MLTRIFGISPDTVRLYEKKGLLKPAKGENNYRIFSRSDFFDMAYILRLKEMGFSLQEIGEIAGEGNFGVIAERTKQRIEEIEKAERELKRAKSVAESFLCDIEEIGRGGEAFELVDDVSILKMDIEGSVAEAKARLAELGLDEVPRLTVVIKSIEATNLAIPEIREATEIIYTLVERERDFGEILAGLDIAEELRSHIEVLPKRTYLRGITFTKPGIDYSMGDAVMAAFKEKGLSTAGPAMSRILYSKLVGEELIDCYETWIPVK